ncbi:MAG: phosphatidate cytidylyltransferase [Lentisphaerota bacterium]
MEISYTQEIYRKLIHITSLWMAFAMIILPEIWASSIFLLLLILNLIVEYGNYKDWPFVSSSYHFVFGKMMRKDPSEKSFKLSGSPFVLASAFLSIILFDKHIAFLAFSVMIVGDTAAALVGRKFGRIRFSNGKTVEGFLAFIISSALILMLCGFAFNYSVAIIIKGEIGIFIAAIAELYGKTIKVDDNFSIPIVIGTIMSL